MPTSYKLSQHDRLDVIMDEIGHGRFHIIAIIGLGCRIFIRGSIFSLETILEPYFKCKYNLTYFVASFYLTLYMFCSALSSPLTGWLANNFGKRKTLLLFSCMAMATAILHIMSTSFAVVVLTMTGYGLFENAHYLIYPYLLEVLCKSGRKYISFVELFYVAGWASGVLTGYLCLKYSSWQWAVIICVIIPLIPVIITLVYIPETPRYLLANGDKNGAVESLVQINLTNDPAADERKLIIKFTEALFESSFDVNDDDVDDDNSDIDGDGYEDGNKSLISSHARHPSSSGLKTTEESCFQKGGELKISNKDLRQRIIAVCVILFTIAISRGSFLYGSGQRYNEESSKQQCNQCSKNVSIRHLISVTIGSSVAILISYNVIGYLKRRLAMRGLITALAIAILPFYFHPSDWLVSCLFFVASVINECLLILMFVYSSEVVPSSVRGFANNLMFAFVIAGSLFAAILVTYLLHVSHFLTFLCLHMCILMCVLVVYRYVIETKDLSLN